MSCSRCRYSRFILAQHKETKHVYAFRCGCDSVIAESIPQWTDAMGRKYDVDFTIQYQPDKKSLAANDKPEPVDDYGEIPF